MAQNRYNGISISLGSQPRHLSSLEDGVIVVTVNDVCIIRNNKKVGSFPVSYEGFCISKNQTNDSTLVAIGGDDSKAHIYELKGNILNEVVCLDHRGVVTDVCFSPDGKYLAACDADRKVIVYSVPGFDKFNKLEWGFHNARINCLAWSPDSTLVASGSLDTMIIAWSMNNPSKHIIIKNSHPHSQVNALVWFDNEKLYSAGHDSLIKSWSVKF